MTLRKKLTSLAASMLAALIFGAAAVSANAPGSGRRVSVIVTINDGDAESAAQIVTESIPGAETGYIYDTILNGFQLTLPESALYRLSAFDAVSGIYAGGSYSLPEDAAAVDVSDAYTGGKDLSALKMIGADKAYEDGFSGSGTVVAVLDSEFDLSHPAFDAGGFHGEAKLSEGYMTKAFASGTLKASSLDEEISIYKSAKIPFAFDYTDRDADVGGGSPHGTHVAGIIGGVSSDALPTRGVAPDCQMLFMKIFTDADKGAEASDYALLAAVEDAIKLGADVINLSLGKYSGSARSELTFGLARIIEKAAEHGCLIVCAAGNDAASTSGGAYGIEAGLPETAYTDYGTISSPASIGGTLAAASVENTVSYRDFFEAVGSDRRIFCTDTNVSAGILDETMCEYFSGQTLEYVLIGGNGSDDDYKGVDVRGKIALIRRGEITFLEKLTTAASHGAVAAIVYNNAADSFSMEITGSPIPGVGISKEDGETLAGASVKKLAFTGSSERSVNPDAGFISSFSSFGPTPSLTLKPEITGVGGNVLSSMPDGKWEGRSGTSMSAPQISGAAALVAEKLNRTVYAGQKADDDAIRNDISDGILDFSAVDTGAGFKGRAETIKTILMNTASPISQENGVEYSPRAQGAGLVNVPAALSSFIRLTTEIGAKAEPGEVSVNGFIIRMTIENTSDRAVNVEIDATLTSDGWTELETPTGTGFFSTLSAEPDPEAGIHADGNAQNLNRYSDAHETFSAALKAGEKRSVELAFIPGNRQEALSEIFTNGWFAEGFIYCRAVSESAPEESGENAADISQTVSGLIDEVSLPFMAYVGEWDAAPVLDGNLYENERAAFGGSSLAVFADGLLIEAGLNPFGGEISSERTVPAFSPNGDNRADSIFLRADLLRNISGCTLTVFDSDGENVCSGKLPASAYITKYQQNGGGSVLLLEWNGSDGINSAFRLPDGDYTLVYELTPDIEGAKPQKAAFNVVVDTKKPSLIDVNFDRERKILNVSAEDGSGLLYIRVYESDSGDSFDTLSAVSGTTSSASFDLSGLTSDHVYIEAADAAYNTVIRRMVLDDAA